MADNTVRYQANFKTPGPNQYGKTLVNVYAETAAELETQLNALLGSDETGPGLVSLILDVEKFFDAGSVVTNTPASQPAQQSYQQQAAPQQSYQQPQGTPQPPGPVPLCKGHQVPMKWLNGLKKDGGTYRPFWACAQPQGQQCRG